MEETWKIGSRLYSPIKSILQHKLWQEYFPLINFEAAFLLLMHMMLKISFLDLFARKGKINYNDEIWMTLELQLRLSLWVDCKYSHFRTILFAVIYDIIECSPFWDHFVLNYKSQLLETSFSLFQFCFEPRLVLYLFIHFFVDAS